MKHCITMYNGVNDLEQSRTWWTGNQGCSSFKILYPCCIIDSPFRFLSVEPSRFFLQKLEFRSLLLSHWSGQLVTDHLLTEVSRQPATTFFVRPFPDQQ